MRRAPRKSVSKSGRYMIPAIIRLTPLACGCWRRNELSSRLRPIGARGCLMPKIKAGEININYEIFGQGEPLLLIMGFGMPGRAWLPRIPRFAGFRVIIYDNRGTGESDHPDQPVYAIAQMADDAGALLRALDIPRAKICGFSMGGMIAQELALRHPEQVTKAVFGCTTAGGPSAQMENPGGGEPLR